MILNQFKDDVFRRTELGEAEIRQRNLPLSKAERTILVSVDGELSFQKLRQEFAQDSSLDFQGTWESLVSKGLIADQSRSALSTNSDLMAAQIEKFNSEEFFSSSMDPLHSGSGLVVDTRSNSMRSVNLKKKKQESVYDVDIPLSLELDTNLRLKKSKRNKKLVQVFPVPEKTKKRRRSKRQPAPPVNQWQFRIYVGLTVLGLLLIVGALFSSL